MNTRAIIDNKSDRTTYKSLTRHYLQGQEPTGKDKRYQELFGFAQEHNKGHMIAEQGPNKI